MHHTTYYHRNRIWCISLDFEDYLKRLLEVKIEIQRRDWDKSTNLCAHSLHWLSMTVNLTKCQWLSIFNKVPRRFDFSKVDIGSFQKLNEVILHSFYFLGRCPLTIITVDCWHYSEGLKILNTLLLVVHSKANIFRHAMHDQKRNIKALKYVWWENWEMKWRHKEELEFS